VTADPRLARLRSLDTEATHGPWSVTFIPASVVDDQHIIERWFVMGQFESGAPTGPAAVCEYEVDAAFIAAIRNALPAMVTLLEEIFGHADFHRCPHKRAALAVLDTLDNQLPAGLGEPRDIP